MTAKEIGLIKLLSRRGLMLKIDYSNTSRNPRAIICGSRRNMMAFSFEFSIALGDIYKDMKESLYYQIEQMVMKKSRTDEEATYLGFLFMLESIIKSKKLQNL